MPLGIGSVTTRYSSRSSGVLQATCRRKIDIHHAAAADGELVQRIAEALVSAFQHAEAAGDLAAVEFQRGRLVVATDLPTAGRALKLIGRHEPAEDALIGVATAAGELEVDPLPALLARLDQELLRHVDRLAASGRIDVQAP